MSDPQATSDFRAAAAALRRQQDAEKEPTPSTEEEIAWAAAGKRITDSCCEAARLAQLAGVEGVSEPIYGRPKRRLLGGRASNPPVIGSTFLGYDAVQFEEVGGVAPGVTIRIHPTKPPVWRTLRSDGETGRTYVRESEHFSRPPESVPNGPPQYMHAGSAFSGTYTPHRDVPLGDRIAEVEAQVARVLAQFLVDNGVQT